MNKNKEKQNTLLAYFIYILDWLLLIKNLFKIEIISILYDCLSMALSELIMVLKQKFFIKTIG